MARIIWLARLDLRRRGHRGSCESFVCLIFSGACMLGTARPRPWGSQNGRTCLCISRSETIPRNANLPTCKSNSEYSTAPLAQPPRPPYQQHPYYRQHDRSHHPLPRSQTLPAPPGHARRDSLGRPPSSVYSQSSQPSPLFTDFSKRTQQNGFEARYTNSPVEVSPPSSPEMDRARHVYVITSFFYDCIFPPPPTRLGRQNRS